MATNDFFLLFILLFPKGTRNIIYVFYELLGSTWR